MFSNRRIGYNLCWEELDRMCLLGRIIGQLLSTVIAHSITAASTRPCHWHLTTCRMLSLKLPSSKVGEGGDGNFLETLENYGTISSRHICRIGWQIHNDTSWTLNLALTIALTLLTLSGNPNLTNPTNPTTKYRCEFVNLFCIYAFVHPHLASRCMASSLFDTGVSPFPLWQMPTGWFETICRNTKIAISQNA